MFIGSYEEEAVLQYKKSIEDGLVQQHKPVSSENPQRSHDGNR